MGLFCIGNFTSTMTVSARPHHPPSMHSESIEQSRPYASHPVVVLHGLESSSANMEPLCEWLKTSFDAQVFNIEIGNGEKTSLYTPLTEQLQELCETLYSIDELQDGFHFIGISQGGLLARGYVEQCNLYPVVNLITLVAPHGGEYLKAIKLNFYSDFFQQHFSVAGYWRDPTVLPSYYEKCTYLPILNNEINNSCALKQMTNILSLTNFVMIWSPLDSVLSPPESGKFSFFDENLSVIPLEDTDLYNDDVLGLRFLDETNRLHTYETNCSHVDHRNPVCYSQLYNILVDYV
jgi:palmitoyl-protein thioesterase